MSAALRGKTSWSRLLLRAAFLIAFVVTLGLNILLATSLTVLTSVSDFIEGLTGLKGVYSQNNERDRTRKNEIAELEAENRTTRNRMAQLENENTVLEKKNAELERERTSLTAKNSELLDERVKLRTENDRLNRDLAMANRDRMVNYRGQQRSVREAVSDSSERITHRVTIAAQRNIAATFAEGLPILGIAVIAGATAWELNDTCELMKDLHELDVAFNPANAIKEREVCGMKVPTKDEIWNKVVTSPRDVWAIAKQNYSELPELSFSDTYEFLIRKGNSFFDWISGATDPAPISDN